MPRFALLIFMYFTEWIIVFTYSKAIYEKRSRFSEIVSLSFFTTLMLIYMYITNIETLNIIFTLICNILCIFVCFKSTFKSAVFHGIALCVSEYISEFIAILLISQVTSTSHNLYKDNELIYVIDLLICRLLFFSICRLFLKFSNHETSTASWGKWVFFAILPISSLFASYVMHMIIIELQLSQTKKIMSTTALVLLIIANIVVYVIYEKSEKNNQKLIELELNNQKNDINMQYLQLLEVKNEKMNIMVHDYKNHLITINEMCNSPQVRDYIGSMLSDISKYNRIAKTKNKWLDVILNKYTDMCDAKQIQFETNVSTDKIDFIDSYDLSSLFNNILDNAYEAALKSQEKNIYLEITKVIGSYHKIILENSSDAKPKTHNNKLVTTKNQKNSHGFGSKSVLNVVNKYHGELQWEYNPENKKFKLIVLFPDDKTI